MYYNGREKEINREIVFVDRMSFTRFKNKREIEKL